ARELLGAQRDVDPPGYLARLRGGDRIFADPTARAPGSVEDGVQDRAQLVDTAGRGALALEVRQEVFQIGAAHARQGQRRDGRREHVLAEAALLDVPAWLRAALIEPPTTKRAKAAGQVVLNRHQPSGWRSLARRAVCSSSFNSAAKALAWERLFASVARWVQRSTA